MHFSSPYKSQTIQDFQFFAREMKRSRREDSKKMLILSARVDEVLRALKSALEYNQNSNKRSKYTVLRFDNDRSTSLYHVKPDYLLDNCIMKEISKKPL